MESKSLLLARASLQANSLALDLVRAHILEGGGYLDLQFYQYNAIETFKRLQETITQIEEYNK